MFSVYSRVFEGRRRLIVKHYILEDMKGKRVRGADLAFQVHTVPMSIK